MNAYTPDYHKEFNLTRPLANEFLAMSHDALREDIQIISNLIDALKDHVSPETGQPADISYLQWYLDRAEGEWERRRERYERFASDPFPPAWLEPTYYESLRAQAEDIKAQLSVEHYLADQVPSIEFEQSGSRLRSMCPYPDHPEDTPSFTIFEDGSAWCFGCHRGGDLFRIIGLIEGLPRFREQLQRATELIPGGSKIIPQNRSFPTHSHRELGRKERSVRGATFQPIRVVNGRVES